MNKLIYALAMSLLLSMSMVTYSKETEKDFKDNIVRLHVIANSNSDDDQKVKLKVRDEILKSGTDCNYKEVADLVLKENGFSYNSHCETGEFYFPNKEYKDITLPAGEYRGLKVVLGDGKGENWWCVMYPPLCFSESIEGEMSDENLNTLKDSLDYETYEMITKKPQIKFKIVEIINTIIEKAKR